MSQLHPPSGLGVIKLVETNKKGHVYIWPIIKIEGATGSWNIQIYENSQMSKRLYFNLRLLNDYGLIIPIKTNKKTYVSVCFILKTGDATSTRIYLPISVHTFFWNLRIFVNLDISGVSSPFRPHVDMNFLVCFSEFYHTAAGRGAKLGLPILHRIYRNYKTTFWNKF